MPNIAVINEATGVTDADVQAMLPAFDTQWNQDLKAVWGVDDAAFTFVPKKSRRPPSGPGGWCSSTTATRPERWPTTTSPTRPCRSPRCSWTPSSPTGPRSASAPPTICEMAVDPWLNSAYQDPRGVFWAGEVCDPVEDDAYGYEIGGVLVTDFVTPNWFGHPHAQREIDLEGHASAPFQSSPAATPSISRPARAGFR